MLACAYDMWVMHRRQTLFLDPRAGSESPPFAALFGPRFAAPQQVTGRFTGVAHVPHTRRQKRQVGWFWKTLADDHHCKSKSAHRPRRAVSPTIKEFILLPPPPALHSSPEQLRAIDPQLMIPMLVGHERAPGRARRIISNSAQPAFSGVLFGAV